MDIETAKFLFQIAQFLLTCGVGFYVYMSNKNTVTNDRITGFQNDVDDRLDQHGERIAKIESGCKFHPSHRDLGDLHIKINAVDGKVSTMSGKMEGIDANLRLILSRITERGLP